MPKRKIPVRKHHGVRDPLRQKAAEFEKIKNKINNPPAKNDQEKIPYSLSQLIKGKNDAKKGYVKKRSAIGIEDKPNTVRNKIKPIKRLANEDDTNYLKRLNRATTDSLKEAEYEMKYGVEVHRNAKTGEITIKKKPKDEFSELLKKNKKSSKAKQNKSKNNIKELDPKLSKQLIKQVLQEEKTEKKKDIEEFKRDHVKFGEVVHAPPSFSVIPKKGAKHDTVPRPGRKDLLLKNVIDENTKTEKKKIANKVKTNFKGKRKDLNPSARSMIEKERTKFIELYRNLRKPKEE